MPEWMDGLIMAQETSTQYYSLDGIYHNNMRANIIINNEKCVMMFIELET